MEVKEDKIRELQMIEHTLLNLVTQRQTFNIEVNEVNSALEGLKNSKGLVYKILGNIMVESSKDDLKKELEDKKKFIDLRMNSIEKQEKIIKSKAEAIQKEVLASMGR